jgi:hypothetical protein
MMQGMPVPRDRLARPGPDAAARRAAWQALALGGLAPAVALLAGCGALPAPAGAGPDASPNTGSHTSSDAPQGARVFAGPVKEAGSHAEALRVWRDAEDVNAWIGAHFVYDRARALRLSETQRLAGARLPIHEPAAFFAEPRGVCVDLAHFAVQTLRVIDPGSQPTYLMIEFDPLTLSGQVLRRHWLVSFRRDGRHFFFADSKRPGHIAGPHASVQDFIDDYARYRGRTIVAHAERDSHQRQQRRRAERQVRDDRP